MEKASRIYIDHIELKKDATDRTEWRNGVYELSRSMR